MHEIGGQSTWVHSYAKPNPEFRASVDWVRCAAVLRSAGTRMLAFTWRTRPRSAALLGCSAAPSLGRC